MAQTRLTRSLRSLAQRAQRGFALTWLPSVARHSDELRNKKDMTWKLHGNDMETVDRLTMDICFCSACQSMLYGIYCNSFHQGTIHVPLNLGSVLTRIHWRTSMALLDKMGGGQSQTVMFGGTGMCSSYFQDFFA